MEKVNGQSTKIVMTAVRDVGKATMNRDIILANEIKRFLKEEQ